MALTFSSKIIDLGFEAAVRGIESMAKGYVLVGWPGDGSRLHKIVYRPSAAAGKGQPPKAEGPLTIAEIAFIMENGSEKNNLPPRPVMGQTIKRTEKDVPTIQGRALDMFLRGVPKEQALKIIAVWFEGELKRSFTKETFAPLQPETIARKGSSRPLIDSGQLRQSITSRVIP